MKYMEYKKLFLFIEGDDDERYFKHILLDLFKKKVNEIQLWKYTKKTNEKRKKFINTINSVDFWDYICFGDYDSSTCITMKKENIIKHLNNVIKNKIIIVIEEIESWYLAGVDNDFLREIGCQKLMDCPSIYITKEIFNNIIPPKMPRINFMKKILDNYDIDKAIKNNKSLKYLFRKILNFESINRNIN